ncbi:MAG: GNAT family N-acetyltransferase [Acidobacteria bacterium]|nr:GNAT family N-acetyltransferase [Acidobacteriota bacterium]MBI3421548.1 GNAT family N-acetyltransferase [Acidobacteriota bacterium]
MSLYSAAALVAVEFDQIAPPSWPRATPPLALQTERYALSLTQTAAELDAVLRLRFAVFNLEMGEGLAASYQTGRDEDEFDRQCQHLIVRDRQNGAIVGTYRLQTNEMAAAGRGFYSATEFDLTQLPARVLAQSLELGRACIAQQHRHTEVLLLLWRGIAAYLQHTGKQYVFGCCSVTSQDARAAWSLTRQLAQGGHLDKGLFVPPQPGFECELEEDALTVGQGAAAPEAQMPKLLRSYLRFGAKVCGPPAIDREFKTIDFFVLFDVTVLDGRAQQLLFETPASPQARHDED